MEFLKEQLKNIIGIDSPSGFTKEVALYTKAQFEALGYKAELTKKGCVLADLGGEGSPLIIGAHIDTLGGMVSEVKGNGRLKITQIGGIRATNAEAENCRIYSRKTDKVYDGCLQLIDASVHVNPNYDSTQRTFDTTEIVIDEDVKCKADTLALGIDVGDYVCFDPRFTITDSGYIKSRFLDDKLSVAIILELARKIKEGSVKPKRKLYAFITVYEEVGHGCSAGLPEADEILAVDMGCVGVGLTCTEKMVSICPKDSSGPYDYEMTTKLVKCALDNNISYALDVYPRYSSDASAALRSGYDLKSALIGAGVYASHGYERSHLEGVKNTLELLKAYVEL